MAERAAAQASSSTTSESLQSVNINMSAVELAPVELEETEAITSSSGSSQSSTAPSQPIRTQSFGQLVGGGSEAGAEQHVEAVGAFTSSSGSSHPSTSSAQAVYGSSIEAVLPDKKRIRITQPVHQEESGPQFILSVSNDTTNAVNNTTMATSVTSPLPQAAGPSRFPAAMRHPRTDPRDADLLLQPHMCESASDFYLECSERRKAGIRRQYLENLLFLYRRLLLEVVSDSWQRNCRLRPSVDRVGPHTNGEYMGMIYSAAGPTQPFVELSHADVLLGDMYVSHHRELIPQDERFVYQDVTALRYRDYISRLFDRFRQTCGPWTEVTPYHSFSPIPPLTPIQRQVLNDHLDMSILILLGYTCPDSTQAEIRVLQAARELQRHICIRKLLGVMAQEAISHNCDIEPLFVSFATATYDSEGSVSDEDTSDDLEFGTNRLHSLMSSFDLSQAAAVLCHVVREMPADQYVIPVIGYTVPERSSPFDWDNFGWFYSKSYEKAALLTESTGHTHLINDLGIEPVFLIEEIMR